MAALLIGLSVAAVLMTALMPAWKQMVRREQESELVFRGQQYVRAIGLFQKRSGPGVLPPNVDVLVSGRFLRKKYKDPITNQDFDYLSPTNAAGQGGGAPQGRGASAPGSGTSAQGRGVQTTGSVIGAQPASTGTQVAGASAGGGIIGVASKSKDASIRIYNGRTHYNEWQFIYVQQAQAPGEPGGPAGGRGGGTPQRGNQPPPFGVGGGQGTGRQGPGGRGFNPQGGRGAPPASPFGAPAAPTIPFQPRPAR